MLDLSKFNFERMAHSIGNDIENQDEKEFIKTLSQYKFGFIATVETLENRDLTPKEYKAIHEKFLSQDFINNIIFEFPNLEGIYEQEKKYFGCAKISLKDIKTLPSIAAYYNIPIRTLQSRLDSLKEGQDYLKLGKRMPTILSPIGVQKIIKNKI